MPNKMLIDSTHPEETRVVVVRGNRVEEFDFETAQRKQIRGNIYLAKVTRVEPSLQAAFIEYGGNRHGFLAFSEIHPDYYQIPVADRQALIEADERAHREAEEDNENRHNNRGRKPRHRNSRRRGSSSRVQSAVVEDGAPQPFEIHDAVPGQDEPADARHELQAGDHEAPATHDLQAEPHENGDAPHGDATAAAAAEHAEHDVVPAEVAEPAHDSAAEIHHHADDAAAPSDDHHDDGAHETLHAGGDSEASAELSGSGDGEADGDEDDDGEEAEEDVVESVGGDDVLEEVPERAFRPRRQYKIQEVIKRRQVMLVQVVKEERGNKGAALTTYLSLAGRYAVLMPNTARGGGISRKITSAQDRSRLKEVVQDLDVPEGMGIILRTAGAARTRPEIKRDFEYLIRMWETVRDTTLKSQAPTLVYEEGSLIKRSLRDLFSKEIDEIQVAGEAGYQEARDFMKMLMPSNVRAVKMYRDAQPLFAKMGVESQLDAMFQPTVQLRSGGYIVLNQTEALVSIDVNSGRSTREHNIEDTALKTNLEAAEEVARQLRLRDLAGLIVIDFIDMDEKRNNRAVERKMSDCLRHDRARIQVGRISHFGLLEMSRQRIRASVLESSTEPCLHCGGTGHVRSVSSVALQLLRAIEEMLMKGATHNLVTRTRTDVALYVLNHKRGHLRDLENTFKVTLAVIADPTVSAQQSFVVDRADQVHTPEEAKAILAAQIAAAPPEEESADDDIGFESEAEVETEESESLVEEVASGDAEEGHGEERKRGRRRRRRGRPGEAHDDAPRTDEDPVAMMTEVPGVLESTAVLGDDEGSDEETDDAQAQPRGEAAENGERRPRRRGRRGGRRRRTNGDEPQNGAPEPQDGTDAAVDLTPGIAALQPADSNRYWNGPDNSSATQADAERPSETQLAPAELKQPEPVVTVPEPVSTAVNEVSADAGERAAARRRSTVREKVSFATAAAPAAAVAETAPEAPAASEAASPEVSPSASPAPAAAPDDGAPRRAGWWSRRFGGG